MRVLIFEPQFMGHNLGHAARLVRALGELPCETHLATSAPAAESAEFELHLAPLRDEFKLLVLDGFQTDRLGRRVLTSGLAGYTTSYCGLTNAIKQVQPEHVYVPYGNQLARIAAAPFGLKRALRRCGAEAETLLIGGKYCYPQAGLAKKLRQQAMLSAVARGPWRRVFHLDDAAVSEVQRHGPRVSKLFHLLPDPHSALPPRDRQTAREALGLPGEGRIVGVVGLIEPRKGIDPLLTALGAARDRLHQDDRLALLGRFHPDVWSLLKDKHADLFASGRVLTQDRLLSNEEMTDAVCAIDVVAAFYPRHRYTSSVLATAAMLQRPVFGSAFGWIGRMIEQFDLGVAADPGDAQQIAGRLVSAVEASGGYQLSPAGRRFIEYVGEANFAATWTARLRERLNLPTSPDLRTWEWAQAGEAHQLRA